MNRLFIAKVSIEPTFITVYYNCGLMLCTNQYKLDLLLTTTKSNLITIRFRTMLPVLIMGAQQ
jgi:hypothetical protein